MRARCGSEVGRVVAVGAALLLISGSAAFADGRVLIRAGGWIDPQGALHRGAVLVVVEGQRVTAVVQDAVEIERAVQARQAADRLDEYGSAVVCPGLIDVRSALGAVGQLRERAAALEPAARAVDALDAASRHFGEAAAAGVTSIALVPEESDVIGGAIGVCRMAGAGGAVLSANGPLRLTIAASTFIPAREPTSRSGAAEMLRAALRAASISGGPLADVAAGRQSAFFWAPSSADVLTALTLAQEFGGLRLVIEHTLDARDVAGELAAAKVPAIVGPFDFDSPRRATTSAAVLHAAGVPVAIAGGTPFESSASLRVGAALAARDGLPADVARRAITLTPAELLGVEKRVGSIAAGKDADLAVFDDDPLRLSAKCRAVYVAGEVVFREFAREQDD
ncbi:MAG: hypothetical protein CHACPFDD_02008 [Phycisphaerae bacterium]|nr:hypothetical protein [Phycisphaerae bacterium]